MLLQTGYLNVHLQHKFCCVMSIERLVTTRSSSLEFDILKRGQEHQYHTRVTSLLAEWRPYSMCGYNSHLLVSLKEYNTLRLNQQVFESIDEMKEIVKCMLLRRYQNGNL